MVTVWPSSSAVSSVVGRRRQQAPVACVPPPVAGGNRAERTRSLHAAHNSHVRMSHARCVVNSVGDTEDGGRLSCVYGGTKSLSTCTRTRVRRPALEKLASPQQASLKLHDEMWAGLPKNMGPRIFRDVEIVPGVQFVWHVLHVLITILSHLGQA